MDSEYGNTGSREQSISGRTIEGIDVSEGIKNAGSEQFLIKLFGSYYNVIDIKAQKIETCLADNMIRDYTVEVHGLKTSSRIIGATELSGRFAQLEKLGNEGNVEEMIKQTPEVLALYRSYKRILRPYGAPQDQGKREAGNDELIKYLNELMKAVDEFDADTMDSVMEKLEECRIPEDCKDLLEQLRAYVADITMEKVMEISKEMIGLLSKDR